MDKWQRSLSVYDWLTRIFGGPALWLAITSVTVTTWGWVGGYPLLYVAIGLLIAIAATLQIHRNVVWAVDRYASSPIKLTFGPQYEDDDEGRGWVYRVSLFNRGTKTLRKISLSYGWTEQGGNSILLNGHYDAVFGNGTLNAKSRASVVFLTDYDIESMEFYDEDAFEDFDLYVRAEAEDTPPATLKLRFTRPKNQNSPWEVSPL
jgi:hypothetical protein